MNYRLKKNSKDGFTIVEFIVAMFIFVMALTIGVAVFLNSLRTQRALLLDMAVNNNMNLALEQMARDIRTGYDFEVTETTLAFKGRDGRDISYGLNGGGTAIRRTIDGGSLNVTGEKAVVRTLKFSFFERSECEPWRITVVLGVSPLGSEKIMNIQTTVTSRVLPRDVGSEEHNVCRG